MLLLAAQSAGMEQRDRNDPFVYLRHLTDVIERNNQEMRDFLGDLGGAERSLAPFASLFGGILARADLDPATETLIPHTLGAVPQFILLSVDMDGLGGVVYGHPAAGGGTLNETAWTNSEVYLKASRAGDFQVVII